VDGAVETYGNAIGTISQLVTGQQRDFFLPYVTEGGRLYKIRLTDKEEFAYFVFVNFDETI